MQKKKHPTMHYILFLTSPHPSINFSCNFIKSTPHSSGQYTYSSAALCHRANRSEATSACVPSMGVSINRTMVEDSFLSASALASHFLRRSIRSLQVDSSRIPPPPPLPPAWELPVPLLRLLLVPTPAPPLLPLAAMAVAAALDSCNFLIRAA